MSTKAERAAFIENRLIPCSASGDEAEIERTFAQDFHMLVPGTGKPADTMPVPDGIAGWILALIIYSNDPGPKAFLLGLHKGFSNIKWTGQKIIPEDDGGENIVA